MMAYLGSDKAARVAAIILAQKGIAEHNSEDREDGDQYEITEFLMSVDCTIITNHGVTYKWNG